MPGSDQYRREGGAALIATLLASSLLVIIGSIASQQAVVSWLVGQRMRESAEALIAAESAVAMAIADFTVEPRFERFDLPAGTRFPFVGPEIAPPLPESFRVRTELRPRSEKWIDVVAIANGRNRSRRTVAATIERADAPYVPAAVFLATPGTEIAFAGRLSVFGSSTAANPVPAIATSPRPHAETLYTRLDDAGANLSGGAASASWSDLDDAVQRVRAEAVVLPDSPSGDIARGIWKSPASVEIESATAGGVWLIDGDLTVHSSLTFEGLLFVLGDIEIDPGADLDVEGALAQLPPGRSFRSRGDTTIRYRADALRAVESLDSNLLGRRAVLIGWRDDS